MRRRHPTHSDAASSSSAILKFIHTVQALYLHVQLNWQSSRFPIWLLRDRTSSRAPYGGLTCTAASTVLKTVGAGDRMGIDTSALRHSNLALWTNWQSYRPFKAEFCGIIPRQGHHNLAYQWRISSEEQNASLSRWRSWVQVPYTSPPIQSLASY